MELSDVKRAIFENRKNPNFSRGFVKPYTKEVLEKFHKWFCSEYFETPDVKTSINCFRNNVFELPVCGHCKTPIKWYKKYCSLSCSSKMPKSGTEERRAAREKIRFYCRVCGRKNVKTEGYRCVECGRKSQAKHMKNLWATDFDRLNKLCQKPRTLESRMRQSLKIKELIKSGKFTPKSNNRRTHRNARYDNIPFRSTWEQRVYRHFKDTYGIILEYETLRIKYKFLNNYHIYIVDFVDHDSKMVYEIKPASMVDDRTSAKEDALISWAAENGYKYQFIDEAWMNKYELFKKYKI